MDDDPTLVDAKVVDVDPRVEPVESVIVADKRNLLGRRLAVFGFALLLLFFTISGYILSAKNARQLRQAAKDRTDLIESVVKLTESNQDQSKFIRKLQDAIRDQNVLLRRAGYRTIPVPEMQTSSQPREPDEPSSTRNPPHTPAVEPPEKPKPKPKPKPRPPPDPPPGPIDQVQDRVCELTGVCL